MLELIGIETLPHSQKNKWRIVLSNKVVNQVIPRSYCFDGASVPRFFWRIIGSNTDNKFLIASMVHDVLCENHHFVNNDREFSTKVFNALLEVSEVLPLRRFVMKHSVDFWQRFCGWQEELWQLINYYLNRRSSLRYHTIKNQMYAYTKEVMVQVRLGVVHCLEWLNI